MSRRRLAHLVVQHRGRKGVREGDLARETGFTLGEMYARLGSKFRHLTRSCYFELQPLKRDGDPNAEPVTVYTWSGVMTICACLRSDRALNFGRAIASSLKTRRRASKNRPRPAHRAEDPIKEAAYQRRRANLEATVSRSNRKKKGGA